ncbi:hypothetical protein BDV41DRAFT_540101 [Aspergillus transmontanensis]|uniref:Uncharacterized protein n=1 Tax=Aspergillus transmontanensis TaxID=1034304 RepID=A0A5N6VTQ0_9EURO|nr:hypothetical protein BDV41DRAFT_540101 [Aspergillus transmontanensis]
MTCHSLFYLFPLFPLTGWLWYSLKTTQVLLMVPRCWCNVLLLDWWRNCVQA